MLDHLPTVLDNVDSSRSIFPRDERLIVTSDVPSEAAEVIAVPRLSAYCR